MVIPSIAPPPSPKVASAPGRILTEPLAEIEPILMVPIPGKALPLGLTRVTFRSPEPLLTTRPSNTSRNLTSPSQ